MRDPLILDVALDAILTLLECPETETSHLPLVVTDTNSFWLTIIAMVMNNNAEEWKVVNKVIKYSLFEICNVS
jgi:hypothetical protein